MPSEGSAQGHGQSMLSPTRTEIYTPERLPTYSVCGTYSGSKPAQRWLAKLAFDLRMYGRPASPEEFLEAIEILFEGDAANWLDASPEYRAIVDKRSTATLAQVELFKEALMTEFPSKTMVHQPQGSIQHEIRNLAQAPNEHLLAYYQRTQHLMRRAHCRDDPSASGMAGGALNPLERIMLEGMIQSFVEGIQDPELKIAVLTKSFTTYTSVAQAYKAAQETEYTLARVRNLQKKIREKKDLQELSQSRTRSLDRHRMDRGRQGRTYRN